MPLPKLIHLQIHSTTADCKVEKTVEIYFLATKYQTKVFENKMIINAGHNIKAISKILNHISLSKTLMLCGASIERTDEMGWSIEQLTIK